jgi:ATP-dependent RNA helicase SUPV3L1/SUV3
VFAGADCPRPPEGAGSFAIDESWTDEALSTAGYLRFGPRAIRADLAERLAWEIDKRRKEAGKNLFQLPPELASIVSCPGADFPLVLKGFNLVAAEKDEAGVVTAWRYARRGTPDGKPDRRPKRGPRQKAGSSERAGAEGKPAPHKDRPARPRREDKPVDPNNPFAVLATLVEPPRPAPKKKPRKKKPKPKSEAPATDTNATESVTQDAPDPSPPQSPAAADGDKT